MVVPLNHPFIDRFPFFPASTGEPSCKPPSPGSPGTSLRQGFTQRLNLGLNFLSVPGDVPIIYIYGSVSKPCTPVVHIKIAGKWMFIPLELIIIGIDPYSYDYTTIWHPIEFITGGAPPCMVYDTYSKTVICVIC